MIDTDEARRHAAEYRGDLMRLTQTAPMVIEAMADEIDKLRAERDALDVMAEVGFNGTMDKGAQVERLRAAHHDIICQYEKIMGDPPDWTTFTGDQLTWIREAWFGAAQISRKALGAFEQNGPQTESEE